jgi:iron complex outermembrane receptor protein
MPGRFLLTGNWSSAAAKNAGKQADGSNYANGKNVSYQDKTVSAFSPKASLSYQVSDAWALRGSYGRGVRFPTVGELFKNVGITRVGGGNANCCGNCRLPSPL